MNSSATSHEFVKHPAGSAGIGFSVLSHSQPHVTYETMHSESDTRLRCFSRPDWLRDESAFDNGREIQGGLWRDEPCGATLGAHQGGSRRLGVNRRNRRGGVQRAGVAQAEIARWPASRVGRQARAFPRARDRVNWAKRFDRRCWHPTWRPPCRERDSDE